MEEKARFRVLVVVVVAVVAGGALFAVAALSAPGDVPWSLATVLILIILALVAIVVVGKERKDLKSGFPKEDERSRAIKDRAGYLAFFVSLYFLLGMGFFQAVLDEEQVFARPPAEWAMIYVAVMGSIFLALHAYLNRKGVPG